MTPYPTALVLGLALLALGPPPARAAAAPGGEKKSTRQRLKDAYADAAKDSRKVGGFMPLRRKDGVLYAELGSRQLGKPILFYSSVYRGVGEGWLLGGMMRMDVAWVLRFEAEHDQVRVIRENVRFAAKPGSPMARAVETAFSDSVVASLPVKAISPGGAYLVPLDPLLVAGDYLGVAKRVSAQLGKPFRVDPGRSYWESVKGFPINTELRLAMALKGGAPTGSPYVADGRAPSVGVQFSFRAPPKKGYKPREADDRVGYFLTARKDFSRPAEDGPWVRYVNRWRLEKADPKAPKSPVKAPLVYYIGRNVPYRWRPYLRQGVLAWNKAFEAAGLLDAVEVRYQTAADTWDPEDVRYNTIRWVFGDVPFGAVGPSRVDPRTGEILDADILFNGDVIRGFWFQAARDAIPEKGEGARHACRAAEHLGGGLALALADAAAAAESVASTAATSGTAPTPGASTESAGKSPETTGAAPAPGPPPLDVELVGAALRWIAMHEVGHTLGLRHNFKASSIYTAAQLADPAFTRAEGLAGSVMDYLPPAIAPAGTKQGEYFMSTVGPYDRWAITYGYQQAGGAADLAKVAARAAEPALAYGSDEDRMSAGARNLDPLVHVNDLTDDPLQDARNRVARIRALYPKLKDRLVAEGRGYQLLRGAVGGLMSAVAQAASVAAVYVGGMRHHRDHKGDKGERPAFVPVPAARQREALAFLGESVFSDASYPADPELWNLLAPSRWRHWGRGPSASRLDFPVHRVVHRGQFAVLARLLSPALLGRLLDLERRAATGEAVFTAAELIAGLEGMLLRELDGPPDAGAEYVSSYRRNLQRLFVAGLGRLARGAAAGAASDAAPLARAALGRVEARAIARAGEGARPLDRAHLEDLAARAAASRAAGHRIRGAP